MAEITTLKSLVDSYGVAVRAGVITPQSEDEAYFRDLMDLPDMSEQVRADWKESGNVRHPITLSKVSEEQDTQPPNEDNENEI